ncbi:MAG: flagellar basal body L-ring protein FlgH [Desulfobacteraceae bacterium]|nr:flagellar basal body L-ring protein FlgH [Desulfobacteraceae bacterium]
MKKYYASDPQAALLTLGLSLLLFSGCATGYANKPASSAIEGRASIPEIKTQIATSMAASDSGRQEGSLWSENGGLADMYTNPKAKRIGDVVTVNIVEQSKASNQASTNTGRESGISAGVTSFFGAESEYPATQGFFNPFGTVGAKYQNDFKGTGTTKRSGELKAVITARVVDILPNGNLVINGSREVMVNSEKQLITLSGIVRPMDITASNEVKSTYLSDARISYSGAGIINDKQHPGWLSRALDKIWPF